MADDRSKTGKDDYSRINIHQTHEINYWTKQLNTSPDRLKKGGGRSRTNGEGCQEMAQLKLKCQGKSS